MENMNNIITNKNIIDNGNKLLFGNNKQHNLENMENYNLNVFKIFLKLYKLSKIIESKLSQSLLIKEEFFLIHLKWLTDFKSRFGYKEIEKFLEEKSGSGIFKENLDDQYIINKFKESKFNQKIISENEFNKINKIYNKSNILAKNQNFIYYKNYAIINKNTFEEMKNNNFYFDERPKTDIYLGNQCFILYVGLSGLECVFLKDYDNFTDEYLINYINAEYRNKAEKEIISFGLQYYFDINKINKNSYVEQYIYDNNTKQKIATVNSINNNRKKEILENVNKAIMDCYNEALSDSQKKNRKENDLILDAVTQIANTIINEKKMNSRNYNYINNFNNNYNFENNNKNKMNIYGENTNYVNYVSQIFVTKIIPKKETIVFSRFKSNNKIGLVNLGNSCYINSVLQCLFHIPEIAKYFLRNSFEPFQSPLSNALNFFVQAIYQPINSKNIPNLYNPLYICTIVFQLNNNFSPTQPNDAKDFLIFVIGRLHQELNKNESNQINNTGYFNIVKMDDPLSNYLQYFASNYQSIISNVFNWTNQVKRTCTFCKSQILSYQTFPYLILDLENTRRSKYENYKRKIFEQEKNEINSQKDYDAWFNEYYQKKENIPIDLIDCIKYYYEKQNYFEFFCPYCQNFCGQTSTNRIYYSPNIFIFILNRGKNNIHSVKMNYPPILEIGDYIESNQTPNKYELIGVITHLGLSGPSGHFIAFSKDPIDEKWYEYNDEKISPANTFKIHNEGIAYILFYRFIKN